LNAQPRAAAFHASEAYRYYVVWILCLSNVLNFVDRQIPGVLIQPIKNEFGLSDGQMGLLGGLAFAAVYTTLGVCVARAADLYSRVNIMSIAIVIWSAFTVVSGFARTFTQLLIARLGVGIGEAGGTPPAYSIISDYIEPRRRATALSIYSMGVFLGQLVGFMAGGLLAQRYGWRTAFWLVGLPGILVALLIRFTVREPPRGYAEGMHATCAPPPFLAVLRTLWSRVSFRHLSLAAGLHAFVSYGVSAFYAAYLMRSHGMSIAQAGVWLGFLSAGGGVIGVYVGGKLSDWQVQRSGDARWQLWIPCMALIVNTPVWLCVFMLPDQYAVLGCMLIAIALGATYLGPSIAASQQMVGVRERSVSGAVLLFMLNLVGLGLGPMVAGYLSDHLNAVFVAQGMARATALAEGLRWSLCILACVNLWSAYHYLMAARSFREDLQLMNLDSAHGSPTMSAEHT
jgi:MFS family permease